MKILIIVDSLGVGGTQEVILNMARNLTAADVTILSVFADDVYSERLKAAGATVRFLMPVKGGRLRKIAAAPLALLKLRLERRAILSSYSWVNVRLPFSLLISFLCRLNRHPRVHFSADASLRQLSGLEKVIFRFLLPRFAGGVSIYKDWYQEYRMLGLPDEKIVFSLYYTSERSSTNPVAYGGSLNVLFVARLVPEKGLKTALFIVDYYNRTYDEPINLHVIGDGPDRLVGEAMVSSSPALAGRVTFHGVQIDLGAFYMNADGMIKTSEGEVLNSVAREMLYLGKLVFTTVESNNDQRMADLGLICMIPRDIEVAAMIIHDNLKRSTEVDSKSISTLFGRLYGNEAVNQYYMDLISNTARIERIGMTAESDK